MPLFPQPPTHPYTLNSSPLTSLPPPFCPYPLPASPTPPPLISLALLPLLCVLLFFGRLRLRLLLLHPHVTYWGQERGRTPLMLAVIARTDDIAALLIGAPGIALDTADFQQSTALIFAAQVREGAGGCGRALEGAERTGRGAGSCISRCPGGCARCVCSCMRCAVCGCKQEGGRLL